MGGQQGGPGPRVLDARAELSVRPGLGRRVEREGPQGPGPVARHEQVDNPYYERGDVPGGRQHLEACVKRRAGYRIGVLIQS